MKYPAATTRKSKLNLIKISILNLGRKEKEKKVQEGDESEGEERLD